MEILFQELPLLLRYGANSVNIGLEKDGLLGKKSQQAWIRAFRNGDRAVLKGDRDLSRLHDPGLLRQELLRAGVGGKALPVHKLG